MVLVPPLGKIRKVLSRPPPPSSYGSTASCPICRARCGRGQAASPSPRPRRPASIGPSRASAGTVAASTPPRPVGTLRPRRRRGCAGHRAPRVRTPGLVLASPGALTRGEHTRPPRAFNSASVTPAALHTRAEHLGFPAMPSRPGFLQSAFYPPTSSRVTSMAVQKPDSPRTGGAPISFIHRQCPKRRRAQNKRR